MSQLNPPVTPSRCPHCGLVGCPCTHQLIEQWQYLPRQVAGDLAQGDDEVYDELHSIGLLALCQAAASWKPDPRGFFLYARQKIRWAMLDELRRRGRYSQRQVQILVLARMAARSGEYIARPELALDPDEERLVA